MEDPTTKYEAPPSLPGANAVAIFSDGAFGVHWRYRLAKWMHRRDARVYSHEEIPQSEQLIRRKSWRQAGLKPGNGMSNRL